MIHRLEQVEILGLQQCDYVEYFVQSLSLLNESNEIDSGEKRSKRYESLPTFWQFDLLFLSKYSLCF